MATVGDLFGELNETQSPDTSDTEDTTTVVKLGDPLQVIENDRKNENSILSDTEILTNCLIASDDLVVAAYKLREFVPHISNNDQSKFWTDSVIPNLLKVLTQDVIARNTLTHAFGAVRDLGIVIQKSAEIVCQTKGSPKAIEIAQKNIPEALRKLDAYIKKAAALDNLAINAFSSNAAELFKIIGPEAADFVKRKAEIESQLDDLYERQNKMWNEHVKTGAEAASLNYLINATQKRHQDKVEAGDAAQLRIAELNELNKGTENKIQYISGLKGIQMDKVTVKSRKFIWFWRQNKETVTTETAIVKDKSYYESLILGRLARIREEQVNADVNEAKIKTLVEDEARFQGQFEMAKKKMENFNNTVTERMNKIKSQTDSLYIKLKKLEDEQIDVETKIGLSGSTLLQCLVNVQTYSQRMKTGATAYSPLVSILNGIKSLVQSDVDLLSGSMTDIFVAGTRLTKLVGFISDYGVKTRQIKELASEDRHRELNMIKN